MQTALSNLAHNPDFRASALEFFQSIGYDSPKIFDFPALSYAETLAISELGGLMNPQRTLGEEWQKLHLLFQFTGDELGSQKSIFEARTDSNLFEAFVFVALELQGESYNRTQLASIARELNKPFASPVIVLFKHGQSVTLASVARREHKKEAGEHVLQKVSLLKDIRLPEPHAAHERILRDLGAAKATSRSWTEFLAKWNGVLDISELNKKFYRELSNWFFAAREHAKFPDPDENAVERGLIRLLTRLIFTWFLKEKRDQNGDGLVPDALFDEAHITALLKDPSPVGSSFYRAVLQNLFFATLNSEMNERRFRDAGGGPHNQAGDYGLSCVFRYQNEFKNPQQWLELVHHVPFLNGGLFECLDPEDKAGARVDGFSDVAARQAHLPNFLFWGDSFQADLSSIYDDKKLKSVTVTPLLNLLHAYKFTIEESTPLEEDVALDPELLGKVFENLLASYNPETRTTARKQLGAFYTPREIVSYMVEESLRAYLSPFAPDSDLTPLLSDTDARSAKDLGFSKSQVEAFIGALERVTILDPACGSGAFPMGALAKMVALLKKLDPKNTLWLETQLQAVDRALEATGAESSVVEDAKNRVREAFNQNDPDYARKLYLIERCLFGVDIQSIALQITKLRCFIALIIDQRIDETKPNRNIRALPNLETKFVAANTLISLPQTGAITPHELPPIEAELAKVRRKHVAPKTRQEKKNLEKEDKRLRGAIEALMSDAGFGDSFVTPIVNWNPYDQNAVAPFFEPERMFGPELKDGFDIVIGNPPYVRPQNLNSELKIQLWKLFTTFEKKSDLYCCFMEKGINILKPKGVLSFIVSNGFLRLDSFEAMRQFLLDNTRLKHIIDFEGNVFESAMVKTCIVVAEKETLEKGSAAVIEVALVPPSQNLLIVPFRKLLQEHFRTTYKNIFDLSSAEDADAVKKKMSQASAPLSDSFLLSFGLKTGDDSKFLTFEAKTKNHKRLLRGENIWTYGCTFIGEFVWFVPEKMSAHRKTARPGNKERFEQPKVLVRDTGGKLSATFDDEGFYVKDVIIVADAEKRATVLEALCGLLNSTTMRWFYETTFPTLHVQRDELASLPIPKGFWSSTSQTAIARRVKKILAAKAADASFDTTQLEREIDELVADLYGLDPEEKKLVGISAS